MRTEIKVEKQIKTIESVTRERFDDQTRSLLEVALTQLENSSGFSDQTPADSPRPVSNSPRRTGKNSEFGPTELR